MKLRNLKWTLDRLSEEELDKDVIFFDPYYNRTIKAVSVDHMASIKGDSPLETSSPLVIVGSMTERS